MRLGNVPSTEVASALLSEGEPSQPNWTVTPGKGEPEVVWADEDASKTTQALPCWAHEERLDMHKVTSKAQVTWL